MPDVMISDTQAALNAGKQLAGVIKSSDPRMPDLARTTQGESIISLEQFYPAPARKKGTFRFTTLDSFLTYVNEHQNPNSRVFASSRGGFTAILDFHGTEPAWGQHRAIYDPEHSDEFQIWHQNSAKDKNQRDFAMLIEDNLEDFEDPKGLDMLDIARHIEGTVNASFGESVRLDNGDTQIGYKTTTGIKAGQSGELSIPTEFTLRIPIFKDGELAPLKCRLRHRVDDGRITFKYEIVKVQKVIDAIVDNMVDVIESKTKTTVLYGTPA